MLCSCVLHCCIIHVRNHDIELNHDFYSLFKDDRMPLPWDMYFIYIVFALNFYTCSKAT